MDASEVARIRNSAAFQELERKRNGFGWTLAILMLAIYMSFIFLVAFGPGIIAQPIAGGPLTLAFPLGLGVIVVAIVLTGVYVLRANTQFDRLTAEIVGQARPAPAPAGLRLMEGAR